MKTHNTQENNHENLELDPPLDDEGEKDTGEETIGAPEGGAPQTILNFDGGISLVSLEDGTLAFAGPKDQLEHANTGGQAYSWTIESSPPFAAVPHEFLCNYGEHAIFTAEFFPIVEGSGDGSSFTVVDYSGNIHFRERSAIRASLYDGTIVWGITGPKINVQDPVECFQFEFVPILRLYGSGEYLVRGPAEKIIENEYLEAFTHDGRLYTVIPRDRIAKAEDGTVVHRAEIEEYANDLSEFRAAAEKFAQTNNTFVFFYNGPIDDLGFNKLVRACEDALKKSPRTKERNRVLLVLVTQGGDPHSAYRCARYLWHHFRGYQILIPGWCKSAGTLLAMGADEIYITEFGELGPIDLQILEKDTDFMDSSATLRAALNAIRDHSFEAFDHFMGELGRHPSMTLQTRSDISTKLTNEIHASISGKIDPQDLGKMHRHLKLCYEYGKRLSARAGNINPEGVRRLVYDYPQHGFVIDRYEAMSELFSNKIGEGLEGFLEIVDHVTPLSWGLRYPYSQGRQIIETIAAPRADF